MPSTRRIVYILATLGLMFIFLPEVLGQSARQAGMLLLLKAAGMALNGPGLVCVSGLGGYAKTGSIFGRILCYLLTLLLFEPVLRWIEHPLRAQPLAPQAPAQVTRRSLLVAGSGLVSATLMGSYAGLYEIHHLQLEQFVLTLPHLPPQLEGLRIVLMSDWHCGPINRPQHLRPAIELANRCQPDLVLLPGDFVSKSGAYFSEAGELAALLRPKIEGGVVVSWGNHDYWEGIELAKKWMSRAGCQLLTNQSLVLTPNRELAPTGRGLWICGLDDLWEGKPKLAETLARIGPDQPRLVLSHNPDVAEEQHGPRVDLMVSGHTHGGQVRIPTLGTPILPSRYGQKYASGLVQGPDYKVYVARGVGSSGLPLRFGVPPEVTVFELRRGSQVTLGPIRLV
ncbi:metallophosphoesterase [bacterium]|nr:metallophosphoesterase [bacterium]